ncbi:MAG: MBL fold metallo-hydrolase [Candidatus Binatia bacterium]|nr:MBL fold metallo-hydrolase [Candidatus Binatia bacterium]MDG1958105.1 MBL fold metallo-hydrolase [Candidatus Binatia bacterium]MDG2011195.1 MBL fold metallo-hydrolase [Candidatus Binatia bacterium]
MAHRQEQESARTEITEITPNVVRMELPISLPGLGHVNCYALLDDQGATVVDPGLPTPASFAALKDRLKQADLKVKDIHTVVITHSHGDHFGGTGKIVRESGAKVVAHRAFSLGSSRDQTPEVSVCDLHAQQGEEATSADVHPPHPELYGPDGSPTLRPVDKRNPMPVAPPRWGGPTPWGAKPPRPPLRWRLQMHLNRLIGKAMRFPDISVPVEAGDRLRLGGREWFIMHTPGHTNDHICLHCPEEGLFLAGDHVLPSITPHISGLSLEEDPLEAFFQSLDRAAAIPHVDQALPAHGHPFPDLAARCVAIKEHHQERLGKIRDIGHDIGPSSVEAFSEQLFRKRSWGSMAQSETYAHLEHLRRRGEAASRRSKSGQLIFET